MNEKSWTKAWSFPVVQDKMCADSSTGTTPSTPQFIRPIAKKSKIGIFAALLYLLSTWKMFLYTLCCKSISIPVKSCKSSKFRPILSLLHYKCWLIFKGMNQKKSLKISRKIWELGELKISVFESTILNLFLQKNSFASFQWKSFNIYRIARINWNFDDYPGF